MYGYGSGVFKQASSVKPLTDVIFVVDDLKGWHMENMKMNPSDYSLIGRLYINRSSIKIYPRHKTDMLRNKACRRC